MIFTRLAVLTLALVSVQALKENLCSIVYSSDGCVMISQLCREQKCTSSTKKNRVTQINVPKAVPVAVRILTTKNSFPLPTGKGNLSRSVVLDVVIALG